jgi:hypothetical protein
MTFQVATGMPIERMRFGHGNASMMLMVGKRCQLGNVTQPHCWALIQARLTGIAHVVDAGAA